MQLPENFEQFKSVVLEKIRTYCDSKIWPFPFEKFCGWLNNFDDPLDEYVALQILDSLIVRSKAMAISSYSKLLSCEIRQFIANETEINPGSINLWRKNLKQGSLNSNIRFAPVRLKKDQGESGSSIYRMLSDLISTELYALSNAKKTPEIIILVDDFLGSGDQFSDFATEFDLSKKLDSSIVVYTPLMALECGIETISLKYPKLKIIPAECLTKPDLLFSDDDEEQFRNDPLNTVADVRGHLESMKIKYAPKVSNWLGYKNHTAPVSFEWGCPNQAPSILYIEYSSEKDTWNRLFNRRAL